MISRYTTMFYNNVTLYRKVLFGLKAWVNKQQQKNIQNQAEQTENQYRK